MFNFLKKQYALMSSVRKPSLFGNIALRYKYNCYVSLRAKVYKYNKIVLGKNVFIHENVMLNYNCYTDDPSISLKIGANTKIMPYVFIQPVDSFINIGEDCTVHPFTVFIGGADNKGIEIGNGVRIANSSVFVAVNHLYMDPNVPIRYQGVVSKGIKIEDDVWIGSNSKILDGVKIGRGSVIGAGRVVTRDIDEFSVVGGVPAKVIKKRS